MNITNEAILPKKFLINEQFSVLLFIKKGANAETYRVKGLDGKLYFLKLFNSSLMHHTAFDDNHNLLEIELLKSIHHFNITRYKDSGELIYKNKKYNFLILDFIVGETLYEKIKREKITSLYDLQQIILGVLNGLNYLHKLQSPIIHNEITLENIMLDLSETIPKVKIIDFGYSRLFHNPSNTYNRKGLDLDYVAPECFNNLFSPQSDIFSVGVLMYHLIFGISPWNKEYTYLKTTDEFIIKERNYELKMPKIETFIGYTETIDLILKKALSQNSEDRFLDIEEFIQVVNGQVKPIIKNTKEEINQPNTYKKKGKGFDAIAGMNELKQQLKLDIIDALHHPEEYEKYGITIPNGLLLYGPPGCGKTFFAKHFAEEVGFNFILATPSTLKSRFINATQENIAKMFSEAEKNAPTIIFIDEINELLPNRDGDAHEMAKSAVNEMLAQMDQTGKKRIFVIGATNYPDMIDPAMLRSGRLDKKFYLPPPDFEARKAMFEMYLKNRPLDLGIDYEKLSVITNNYVSSDIEFIVNEASRSALKEKSRITMSILETTIVSITPSVSIKELQKYEITNSKMQFSLSNESNRIGFNRKTH